MLMDTHTVSINAAFLQEIKDDDVQLQTLLKQARAMCDTCRLADIPASRFATILADLQDQLAMHFALEEAYGYFDDPVSVAPHLSEQAEALRKQHGQLFEEMIRLAETAQDILRRNRDPRGFRNLARCFMNFYDRLQEHEENENELIIQAFTMDIADLCSPPPKEHALPIFWYNHNVVLAVPPHMGLTLPILHGDPP